MKCPHSLCKKYFTSIQHQNLFATKLKNLNVPCSLYLPSLCGTLFVKLDFETLGSWYLDHTRVVGIICVWMTALLYNRLEAAMYTAVVGCHVFQLRDAQLEEHGRNLYVKTETLLTENIQFLELAVRI